MSNTSNGNPTPSDVTLVAGSDGTNVRTLKTDSTGNALSGAITDATSNGYGSRTTVTRPANTTAYTANDVVGAAAAAINLGAMGPSGCDILITSASLEIDVTAVPSGMTTFRLALYNVTPPGALADNAAFDIPAGDRTAFLGYIDLGTPVDEGSTLFVQAQNINKHVTLSGTNLFAYLITAGGFTPAGNSEVYVVTVKSVAV